MKKIINTEKTPKTEWLFGGNPNAIESQEKEGQEQLLNSSQLPRKCNYPRNINIVEQYQKMGIKVFTTSKDDDLFMGVNLPHGWRKEKTEHSMWSNIVDSKNRIRATIFYKAAFYDRDAFINFSTAMKINYSGLINDYGMVVLNQNNDVIFDTGSTTIENYKIPRQKCLDFLNENYPNHEDINAYWD